MPTVPYTVAQQIVSFLYVDMILHADTRSFTRLALTSKGFKAAVYQHRKALMFTQAALSIIRPVKYGFPNPKEAKNPYVCLDHILADCIQYAPEEVLALIEKYRSYYERDLVRGPVVIWGDNGSITVATEGRYLPFSHARPETVLLKNAVFVRAETDPRYDECVLGHKCEFAFYYDEGVGEPMLWTEVSGLLPLIKAQVDTILPV
ncbi:hypothetical protein BDZ88DRAFT_452612 [Geranomyces variabilis]|nr:hypothetical protein BDZ88DRAFT_452612 [Geranomyces variabilis]KAJ3135100.1 hypothetical protein HDU90_004132 [Geranomyces variabilis]